MVSRTRDRSHGREYISGPFIAPSCSAGVALHPSRWFFFFGCSHPMLILRMPAPLPPSFWGCSDGAGSSAFSRERWTRSWESAGALTGVALNLETILRDGWYPPCLDRLSQSTSLWLPPSLPPLCSTYPRVALSYPLAGFIPIWGGPA